MAKKNIIIVLLIIMIILAIVGIVLGIGFYRNSKDKDINKKAGETFNLTLQDMYCNIKDSKKIVKTKITIETNNKKTLEFLEEKQFLIRNDINKIIRNKTEDDLQGENGQVNLQKEILESLIKIFDDESIINIYFDDFIIQ